MGMRKLIESELIYLLKILVGSKLFEMLVIKSQITG